MAWRRAAIYSAAFLLVVLLVPISASAAPDPLTCSGYPEQRVFMEAQGWWTAPTTQQGTDFGHLHMGTCFPLRQTVSGTVHFDVRVVMHMNPGALLWIKPFICRNPQNTNCVNYPVVLGGQTCSVETCEFWFGIDLDTTLAPDGVGSIRFRTEVKEPDGNVLRASNDWLVNFANGNPVVNFSPADTLRGKGWYTKGKYSTVDLLAGYPKPASGPWTITYKCGGSQPQSDCLVTIDPDFHMGNDGMIVRHDASGGKRTITIPTTGLAPGLHYLVIRAEAQICQTVGCTTKAGLLRVPFQV